VCPSELTAIDDGPEPTITHEAPFQATSFPVVGAPSGRVAADQLLAFVLHRTGDVPLPTATIKFSVTSSPANAEVPAAFRAMRFPVASTLIGVPPR
jgi:hypothetical protein